MKYADKTVPMWVSQIVARWTLRGRRSHPKIHSPRKVDSRKKASSASKASGEPEPLGVARTVPDRLHDGDQSGQTDGDRDEEEVIDGRDGELPPSQVQGGHRVMSLILTDRCCVSQGWDGSGAGEAPPVDPHPRVHDTSAYWASVGRRSWAGLPICTLTCTFMHVARVRVKVKGR